MVSIPTSLFIFKMFFLSLIITSRIVLGKSVNSVEHQIPEVEYL